MEEVLERINARLNTPLEEIDPKEALADINEGIGKLALEALISFVNFLEENDIDLNEVTKSA